MTESKNDPTLAAALADSVRAIDADYSEEMRELRALFEEVVRRAVEEDELVRDARLVERLRQPLALAVGHQLVLPRVEEKRRLDPDARARGLAAMRAAIAQIGLPPKGKKSSS